MSQNNNIILISATLISLVEVDQKNIFFGRMIRKKSSILYTIYITKTEKSMKSRLYDRFG